MIHFLYKVLLFFFSCLLIDYAGYYALKSIRPSDYGAFLESRETFTDIKSKYDVLFMGDSHIADAVNVKLFEDSVGLSAYNLGIYHSTPFDNYFFLKKIIKRGKQPKYIVFGTNPDMFYKDAKPSKYIYPVVNDRLTIIDMNIQSEKKFDGLSLVKSCNEKYLVTAFIKNILNKKYIPTREVKSAYNGSLEFYNQTDSQDWNSFEIRKDKVNPLQISYFTKLIELAKRNSIEVLIFNPPIWKNKFYAYQAEGKYFKDFDENLSRIINMHQLKVYNKNHDDLNELLEKRDFLNPDHLNFYGSCKVSLDFVQWFKRLDLAFE